MHVFVFKEANKNNNCKHWLVLNKCCFFPMKKHVFFNLLLFSHSVRTIGLLSEPQSVTINNNNLKKKTRHKPVHLHLIHIPDVCARPSPPSLHRGATSRVELIDILLTHLLLFLCIRCESQVLPRLAGNVWFAVLCSHERLFHTLPCCRISLLAWILNVDQSCRTGVILG